MAENIKDVKVTDYPPKTEEDKAKLQAKVDRENKIWTKYGHRLVELTDVTVTRELLVKALVKHAGLPGNEIPGKADKILKFIIEEGK